jgi:hypothetical protein
VPGVRIGKLWRFRASELFPSLIQNDDENDLDGDEQAR